LNSLGGGKTGGASGKREVVTQGQGVLGKSREAKKGSIVAKGKKPAERLDEAKTTVREGGAKINNVAGRGGGELTHKGGNLYSQPKKNI